MKIVASVIIFLAGIASVNAAEFYRCEIKGSMVYQKSPCKGEQLSFNGGTQLTEAKPKPASETAHPAPLTLAKAETAPTPAPKKNPSKQKQQKQKTVDWALRIYDKAAIKARNCKFSLKRGDIQPCVAFADYTGSNSEFTDAYQYLERYNEVGLDSILEANEHAGLKKSSDDVAQVTALLNRMIELAQNKNRTGSN